MKQLFAERFRSARIKNALSLQDLAEKLETKISRQALHKYETGLVVPDSEMIQLLSKALDVRPDYFFSENKIELTEIEFRKLKSFPAKEEKMIIEQVKDILSRYLELEKILSIETKFKNPLEGYRPIKAFEDVEEAAQKVRIAWKLGTDAISNSIELLEDKHIKVILFEHLDDCDGMQTWVNNSIPVIAINKSNMISADRFRFTALHELAHLLLPLKHLPEKQKEKFCHQFAASLLLPADAARSLLGTGRTKLMIGELGLIKKQYGISIQAIVMRAKDLGIITQAYCTQFFFYMKQMDWRVHEPVEYEGREISTRFDQLLLRALAEEIISMSKAASLRNQTVADFKKDMLTIA